jgi:cation:H+ antiporter
VTIAAILGGLVLLMIGGELVVRGGSRLATAMGISPVVVGLTVVAFGTSSPELAVTLGAVSSGQPDVAIGNVVGSNIYNILLVLGLGAVAAPLVVRQRIVRADVPLLVGVSLLFWAMASNGALEADDGLVLVAILVGYTAISIRSGRRETAPITQEYRENLDRRAARTGPLVAVGLIVAGLAALVGGSQALVGGATEIARSLGVSELVIGLTVVAIGTSMPEIVTTVIASVRGERDLAVGNVVGSNLFNLLGVLGIGAIVAPRGIPVAPAALSFDIPIMIAVAIALLPIVFTGHAIRRWEGALFLTYAAVYTAWLVLDATGEPLAQDLATATTTFLIPLTLITLATVVVREIRSSDAPAR